MKERMFSYYYLNSLFQQFLRFIYLWLMLALCFIIQKRCFIIVGIICLMFAQLYQFAQYFQNRKMVAFSQLFLTTNKGIPNITDLPASTTLAKPFYVYSILLQALILIFFIFYFALSIFRVIKKIKNYHFEQFCDHNSTDEEGEKNGKNESERNNGQNEHEKEDKLIYRFDDEYEDYDQKPKEGEQNEENDKLDKEDEAKQQAEKQKEESFDNYHDENEEAFIELDDKLLFMQPFLISFVACNNLFTTDPSTITLFALTIISFILFNVKGKLPNLKIAKVSFIAFSLLGFLAFFYNDHDLTT